MEYIIKTILIGIGGTIAMDIWALLLKHLFNIQSLNYAFVGRWIGHFSNGKFMHNSIAKAPPIAGEKAIGWCAHYLIGITFSILLVIIWGYEWIDTPRIIPALIIGIATTIAPFLIMQPGMGLGIAAAKLPNANTARFRSLLTHTIYGIGLYLTALILTIR
ncbi:MAG TPA: DUF2938 domain-containing protein [Chitinophaga sp.]|uniref:DUF2938 domain-containing protein n=1 Tax=Chitinophaga sp. TaxID=1869181 RepID=UPI002C129E37|nr:DUF2938 domain-containing protein [Chitinophaga sp.]HVI45789.1 DUF2938 domain-containing protein [Chitinophaga sp.]